MFVSASGGAQLKVKFGEFSEAVHPSSLQFRQRTKWIPENYDLDESSAREVRQWKIQADRPSNGRSELRAHQMAHPGIPSHSVPPS